MEMALPKNCECCHWAIVCIFSRHDMDSDCEEVGGKLATLGTERNELPWSKSE